MAAILFDTMTGNSVDYYRDAIAFLDTHEREPSRRLKLPDERIAMIKRQFPGIPDDYLDYLRLIGWGSFRESQYMVYEEPSCIAHYLHDSKQDTFGPNVLGFGDDFSGYFGCFLVDEDWAIAETFHGGPLVRYEGDFGKFIRERMLIGTDGENQRKE